MELREVEVPSLGNVRQLLDVSKARISCSSATHQAGPSPQERYIYGLWDDEQAIE